MIPRRQSLGYLYIPYTDTVVVVQANPPAGPEELARAQQAAAQQAHSEEERTAALRRLYASTIAASSSSSAAASPSPAADPTLTATQLRDLLLAAGPGPLDKTWVAKVNAAEADYWRRSLGTRVGWSDEVLGFDCGGQQWVLEVAFPVAPSLEALRPGQRTRDLEFMDALLGEIQKAGVHAPSPIEVRWTAGSSLPLSPAAGPPESVHCWVGVIMYLPEEPEKREEVTRAFREYARIVETRLMPRFNATWHWAKLEAEGRSEGELAAVRQRLAARFGPALGALRRYRAVLDPEGRCGNKWTDAVLGGPQ